MARSEELRVNLTATDDASPKIEKAATAARGLDGTTARVDVEAGDGFAEVQEMLDELPGRLGEIGALAGKAAGPAAIGAVVAGLGAAAANAADTAIEVAELARLTGDTTEDASRLATVWKNSGADTKDLQDIILNLNDQLAESPELAAQLGIQLDDGKTSGERFAEVVNALNTRVGSTFERGRIGARLFGEEGVRQVNALSTQVGNLDDAMANVDERQIISDDEVADAIAYRATMNELSNAMSGLAVAVGQEVVPMLTEMAGVVTEMVDALDALGLDTVFDVIGAAARRAFFPTAGVKDAILDAGRAAADVDAPIFERFGGTLDHVADATRDLTADMGETGQTLGRTGDAADAAAADIRSLDDAYRDLIGALNDEQAWHRVDASFDRFVTLANDAEASTKDVARELTDLKLEVATYAAEVLKLPPTRVSKLVAEIDAGNLVAVRAELDRLAASRPVPFLPQIGGRGPTVSASGFRDRGGLAPAGSIVGERRPELVDGQLVTGPAMLGRTANVTGGADTARLLRGGGYAPTFVTINMPAGASAEQVVRAQRRYARQQGPT